MPVLYGWYWIRMELCSAAEKKGKDINTLTWITSNPVMVSSPESSALVAWVPTSTFESELTLVTALITIVSAAALFAACACVGVSTGVSTGVGSGGVGITFCCSQALSITNPHIRLVKRKQ